MKNISLLLVLLAAFFLTACNKKSDSQEQSRPSKTIQQSNTKDGNDSSPQSDEKPQTFTLTDIDERDLTLTIEGNTATFRNIVQPLVLINFFATWCPPCRAELPDLSQLQKNHAKELFVIGVLVNDEQNSTQLRLFMKTYGANYFISHTKDNENLTAHIIKKLKLPENFPIPLSILYRNGKFFRYYEGAMPIEMIENELKQALKQP